MIVSFFSNYFNHHQKALCDSIASSEGVEFHFIETEPMEEFRQNMGWGVQTFPEYVLCSHKDENAYKEALRLGIESDLVIIGSAPEIFIKDRLEQNKLIFRYTERPLKEGVWKMYVPHLYKRYKQMHYANKDKNIYVLGASAYAAYDYNKLGAYDGRVLKFGYFPVGEALDETSLFGKKRCSKDIENLPLKILWTGRFLKLKHPELLIEALANLKKMGIKFEATIVGNGSEEKKIKSLALVRGLDDNILFMDFVTPDRVRELMEEADIYVCTSNHLEGWGSVIYEAASAGCAVVASHLCGSSPFLIKPGKTGFLFKSGNVNSLTDKLMRLTTNRNLTYECGLNSYRYMKELWNPDVAGKRIVEFAKAEIAGKPIEYKEGPLSVTEVLKNSWYKE